MTQEEIKLQVIKECANDLIHFAKTTTPVRFKLPTPDFHYEMAALMMDRSIPKIAVEAPRGFAKTTISISMVLHHIVYDEGDKVVLIQSKNRDEALNRIADIKNIFNYSSNFINIFGYSGENVSSIWREDKIKTKVGKWNVTIKAIGTGQQTRGTLESGVVETETDRYDVDVTRITLFLLDDPDDEKSTITKEQMAKNWSKLQGDLQGLADNGRAMAIGTPIREGCMIERIFSNPLGWTTLHYQAYWEEDGEIKLLWKEKRSKQWLDNKLAEFEEDGISWKFWSEYMCQIIGDKDRMFKDWKYWDGELFLDGNDKYLRITHLNNDKLPFEKIIPVKTYLGIDPASSTHRTADYSVTFAIAYDNNRNIYCLDIFRNRVKPHAHAEQIIEMAKLIKPDSVHVETIAYQEMLKDHLLIRMKEEGIFLPGLNLPFKPRVEKTERLDALEPLFAMGKVWLKPNMQTFEEELSMYPKGRHEDILDGFFYATRRLMRPTHEVDTHVPDDEEILLNGTRYKQTGNWMTA